MRTSKRLIASATILAAGTRWVTRTGFVSSRLTVSLGRSHEPWEVLTAHLRAICAGVPGRRPQKPSRRSASPKRAALEQSNHECQPYHPIRWKPEVLEFLGQSIRCRLSVKNLIKGGVFVTLVSLCAVGVFRHSTALEWVSVVATCFVVIRYSLPAKSDAPSRLPRRQRQSSSRGDCLERPPSAWDQEKRMLFLS